MRRRSPIEVLAVTTRGGARRAELLGRLVPDGGVTVADARPDLADPRGFDAVVLDGPEPAGAGIPPRGRARLGEMVGAGGRLLVLGPDPDGSWGDLAARAAGDPVPGEVFAKVADDRHGLVRRLPAEFPVDDRFTPLTPPAGAEVPVAVSVAFRDRPAVARWALGAGRVVTSGLGQSDAALADPHLRRILARCLRPAPEVEDAERALGVGVVGYGPYGGMGYYHGLACASTPGLELVAACDSSAERRKAAEDQFPGIRTYADVGELAADDDLDVAVVATPPTLHASVCLKLLKEGRHVACEKPLAMTAADVDRLAAAAREGGLTLTVNQNRRWDPDFVALRRAVDAGQLGELFNVETFVGGYEHPCRAWHSDVEVSGGAVYDWGSHHVDWIIQLLGSAPRTVQTFAHKRVWHDVTNLDQLRVRMWWEDGREAEFLQSDIAAVRRPKFYVQGTAGTLVGHYRPVVFERLEPGHGYVAETAHHAEAPAELTLARYETGYGLTEARLPPAPRQPFAFHRNLADHLLGGEPLAVTVESVRHVISVLEAAQRSSDAGGTAVAPSAPAPAG